MNVGDSVIRKTGNADTGFVREMGSGKMRVLWQSGQHSWVKAEMLLLATGENVRVRRLAERARWQARNERTQAAIRARKAVTHEHVER